MDTPLWMETVQDKTFRSASLPGAEALYFPVPRTMNNRNRKRYFVLVPVPMLPPSRLLLVEGVKNSNGSQSHPNHKNKKAHGPPRFDHHLSSPEQRRQNPKLLQLIGHGWGKPLNRLNAGREPTRRRLNTHRHGTSNKVKMGRAPPQTLPGLFVPTWTLSLERVQETY